MALNAEVMKGVGDVKISLEPPRQEVMKDVEEGQGMLMEEKQKDRECHSRKSDIDKKAERPVPLKTRLGYDNLTSPHLTSPHLTASPHLTSPHFKMQS